MKSDLSDLINKLKELNIFLASNLNSSELWVKDQSESQALYHLVIALHEDIANIDVSSDSFLDLYDYLENIVNGIETGNAVNWSPTDIRKGVRLVRKQDQDLGRESI